MKKVLYIQLIFLLSLVFFSFSLKTPVKAEADKSYIYQTYMMSLQQNYDDYMIIVNDQNNIGEIIVAIGSIKKVLTYSICFYDKTYNIHPLQIEMKENKLPSIIKTFSKDQQLNIYYQLPIDNKYIYNLSIVEEKNFAPYTTYELTTFPDYETYKKSSNLNTGSGKHQFPTEDKWINNKYTITDQHKITITMIFLSLFIFFAVVLTTILIIYLFKQKQYRQRKYIVTLDEILALPVKALKGKTICFGTDTVYGIGALINDEKGKAKIYRLKHREPKKPLAVLASSTIDIFKYAKIPNRTIIEIMRNYWPGALTIILDDLQQSNKTIAFRIPNNKYALQILKHFGPIATTSVNISKEPPLNTIEDIDKVFGYKIDYIVKYPEEHYSSNISSTVVKITEDHYTILRQGEVIINDDVIKPIVQMINQHVDPDGEGHQDE